MSNGIKAYQCLWGLPVFIPVVLIGSSDSTHVDGKVAVPVGAMFHSRQSWKVGCNQFRLFHQLRKRYYLAYDKTMAAGLELFQSTL